MAKYHDYGIRQRLNSPSATSFWAPLKELQNDKRIYLANIDKYRNKITVNKVARLNPMGQKEWSFWFAVSLVTCMVRAYEGDESQADITICFNRAYYQHVSLDSTRSIRKWQILDMALQNGVLKQLSEDTYELQV